MPAAITTGSITANLRAKIAPNAYESAATRTTACPQVLIPTPKKASDPLPLGSTMDLEALRQENM